MWHPRRLPLALALAVTVAATGCSNGWGPLGSQTTAAKADAPVQAPRERGAAAKASSAYDAENVAFGSREWWAMKEREKSTAR